MNRQALLPTYKGEDYTGKLINGFTVLELFSSGKRVNGKKLPIKWKVKCACGATLLMVPSSLFKQKGCRECYGTKRIGSSGTRWKGVGQVPYQHFWRILSRANTSGLEVGITLEYLSNLYEQQEGMCALSGLPLTFGNNSKTNKVETTASIDRIDSSKGYIEGNVQWVHKDINTMKWNLPIEKFIEYCKLISNNFSNN